MGHANVIGNDSIHGRDNNNAVVNSIDQLTLAAPEEQSNTVLKHVNNDDKTVVLGAQEHTSHHQPQHSQSKSTERVKECTSLHQSPHRSAPSKYGSTDVRIENLEKTSPTEKDPLLPKDKPKKSG